MDIINFFTLVVLVSLLAGFILVLLKKWGVIEWMQINGHYDLIIRLSNCDFCLSWWTCVILSILLALFSRDSYLLFIPFFSTMFTRVLL